MKFFCLSVFLAICATVFGLVGAWCHVNDITMALLFLCAGGAGIGLTGAIGSIIWWRRYPNGSVYGLMGKRPRRWPGSTYWL